MPKAPTKFDPIAQRLAYGRALRESVRRVDQDRFQPARRRPSVLEAVRQAEPGRVPELLPIKYGRMSLSPFAFFRGSAQLMAFDLAQLPSTGISVQICGDAHVRNLGAYASADGRIVFDINDFDETCRAPWEWDLKRLAASFVLAGREAGNSDRACGDAVQGLSQAYRQAMKGFATMPAIELARYQVHRHVDEGPVARVLGKAERATASATVNKLTVTDRKVGRRFASRPPLLTRVPEKVANEVLGALASYRDTLGPNRQLVLDAYRPVDVAFKVVGTGSVGTRDYVVLCFGNGIADPLILQVKEAVRCCYAPYLPAAPADEHQGKRVAEGQHRLQTWADPFLGWTQMEGRQYLVRQLADHKASIEPTDLKGAALVQYALVCGEIFAKGHARTGDPAVLAGYGGDSDKLDVALSRFALTYANQATADHAAFLQVLRSKQLVARKV
jgi:uncharacterized protein (DUF2252 family)